MNIITWTINNNKIDPPFKTIINRSLRLFLLLPTILSLSQFSMRSFAQRRKSTQSTSKLTFKKDSFELDQLSNELNKLENKKTNDKNAIKKEQHKSEKFEHIKSVADLSMEWSTVNSEIKQEDQQDIYNSLKTEYPKSGVIHRKYTDNPNTSFLLNSNHTENTNQETGKRFVKQQPPQLLKKQTVIKSALTTPRQPKSINLQTVKATQMISRREKDKITVRLKGLIQLVQCTQIAADNLPEILATIDKLGEKIKKS